MCIPFFLESFRFMESKINFLPIKHFFELIPKIRTSCLNLVSKEPTKLLIVENRFKYYIFENDRDLEKYVEAYSK